MTDHSLPGRQVSARWSSGDPTVATSGASWVHGKRWGRLDGTLAVAALKASRVIFMKFGREGRLKWTGGAEEAAAARPPALRHRDARRRAADHHRQRRRRRRGAPRQPQALLAVRSAPAEQAPRRPRRSRTRAAASAAGEPGQPVGCGVHQRRASDSATSHTATSPATTNHGVASTLAPIRNSTHTIPAMPDERPGRRPGPHPRRRECAHALSPRARRSTAGRCPTPRCAPRPSPAPAPPPPGSRRARAGRRCGHRPAGLDGVVLDAEPVRRLAHAAETTLAPCLSQPPSPPARSPPGARCPPTSRAPSTSTARARAVHRQRGQGRRDDREDPGRGPARRPGTRARRVARRPGRHDRRARPDRPRVPVRPRRLPLDPGLQGLPEEPVLQRQRGDLPRHPRRPPGRGRRPRQHRHHGVPRRRARRHQRHLPRRRRRRGVAAARRAHPRGARARHQGGPAGPPGQRDRPGDRELRPPLRVRRRPRVHRPRHRDRLPQRPDHPPLRRAAVRRRDARSA